MKINLKRYLLAVALIVVAVFFIYPHFKTETIDVGALISEANKPLLLVVLLFPFLNILCDTWLSTICLAMAGEKLPFKNVLRVTALGALGNEMVPLVGGTMLTFLGYKTLKVPMKAIVFLVTAWMIFVVGSQMLGFIGSVASLPNEALSLLPQHFGFILSGAAAIIAILVFLLLRNRGKRLHGLLKVGIGVLNNIFRLFKKTPISVDRPEKIVASLYAAFAQIKKNKKKIPFAILAAFSFYATQILAVWFSFLVFGYVADINVINVGFLTASLLGALTFAPESPGVMEASLSIVFVKLGLPAHISLFSTLLYRLLNYWILLPIGLIFLANLKKENKEVVEIYEENGKPE